jgi:hypothetical protein
MCGTSTANACDHRGCIALMITIRAHPLHPPWAAYVRSIGIGRHCSSAAWRCITVLNTRLCWVVSTHAAAAWCVSAPDAASKTVCVLIVLIQVDRLIPKWDRGTLVTASCKAVVAFMG